jgi:hypothetical protein
MDINGSKGIFRVHIDVYPHFCPCESSELSLLCRGSNKQQTCFSDSVQSHYCISDKTCYLISWSVKSSQLESTSSISCKQSWSGGPGSTGNRVAGFRVLTTSNWIHEFSHNTLWFGEFVSQWFPLYSMSVKTEWRTWTVSSCPKVSLSASVTKMAEATRAHRQGDQPWETASCFDN